MLIINTNNSVTSCSFDAVLMF